MEQQEIQTLRALMEYEAARTAPPESFPDLPDTIEQITEDFIGQAKVSIQGLGVFQSQSYMRFFQQLHDFLFRHRRFDHELNVRAKLYDLLKL